MSHFQIIVEAKTRRTKVLKYIQKQSISYVAVDAGKHSLRMIERKDSNMKKREERINNGERRYSRGRKLEEKISAK